MFNCEAASFIKQPKNNGKMNCVPFPPEVVKIIKWVINTCQHTSYPSLGGFRCTEGEAVLVNISLHDSNTTDQKCAERQKHIIENSQMSSHGEAALSRPVGLSSQPPG